MGTQRNGMKKRHGGGPKGFMWRDLNCHDDTGTTLRKTNVMVWPSLYIWRKIKIDWQPQLSIRDTSKSPALASAMLVRSLEMNMASCQTTPKRLDTNLKAHIWKGKSRSKENETLQAGKHDLPISLMFCPILFFMPSTSSPTCRHKRVNLSGRNSPQQLSKVKSPPSQPEL